FVERSCDKGASHLLWHVVDLNFEARSRPSDNAIKDVEAIVKLLIVGIGKRVVRRGTMRDHELVETVRITHWKFSEQQRIEHTEDCRIGPYAERQREDSNYCETRALPQ